jgi:hypothetical protein
MKVNGNYNFHGGDVQGFSIDSLPPMAKRIKQQPLAYGETSGHCHILTGDVELFEHGGKTFAVVGKDGAFHQHIKESSITPKTYKINKNISNADHTKDCKIAPGVYAIGIHQKYNPFSKVFEKVLD